MKTTKLSPELEQQRLIWVSLLRTMHEQERVDKWKDQLSPSFEYRNWRCNVEHRANFDTVILRRLGSGPRPMLLLPNWLDNVSPSDKQQGWDFRRRISPDELPQLLIELAQYKA